MTTGLKISKYITTEKQFGAWKYESQTFTKAWHATKVCEGT